MATSRTSRAQGRIGPVGGSAVPAQLPRSLVHYTLRFEPGRPPGQLTSFPRGRPPRAQEPPAIRGGLSRPLPRSGYGRQSGAGWGAGAGVPPGSRGVWAARGDPRSIRQRDVVPLRAYADRQRRPHPAADLGQPPDTGVARCSVGFLDEDRHGGPPHAGRSGDPGSRPPRRPRFLPTRRGSPCRRSRRRVRPDWTARRPALRRARPARR